MNKIAQEKQWQATLIKASMKISKWILLKSLGQKEVSYAHKYCIWSKILENNDITN